MKVPVRASYVSLLLTFAAAGAHRAGMKTHPSYREALEHAGDIPLPGSSWVQDPAGVAKVLGQLSDTSRAAYAEYLGLDNTFILLVLMFFISIAWVLWQGMRRKWASAVAVLALLYAGSDWTENQLVREMLARPAEATGLVSWSVAASSVKLVLAQLTVVLALLGLLRLMGSARAWGLAFFQDVPFILDSLWRRTEFLANREFLYTPAPPAGSAVVSGRPCWHKPPFVFFCLTVVFLTYGPTLDGLCSLAPQAWSWLLPLLPGVASLWLLVMVIVRKFFPDIKGSIGSRFVNMAKRRPRVDFVLLRERLAVTTFAMLVGTALLLLPAIAAIGGLLVPAIASSNACEGIAFSPWSIARLAVCVGAILAFARVCHATHDTPALLHAQALIGAIAGAVLWFGIATPQATEASGLAYRHVFGFLAPVILVLLALGPTIAAAIFRPSPWQRRYLRLTGILPQTGSLFRFLLTRRELFVPRGKEPQPVPSRVLFALLQGISYRALQLAVPPALLAFVAPAGWVSTLAWYGLVLALLLSTWGNLSRRWQQMSRQVDRWFLSGSALFVSLFVIVVAGLRIYGVDYVTTILDAAPFGVLFAIVVMSYVLSWLVEYWINRTVAVELFSLLGGDPVMLRMAYQPAFNPTPAIRVARADRVLGYHGIGRFLVVGTLVAPHLAAGGAREPGTAFHTYDLLDLFRALVRGDSDRMAEVVRYSHLYFYAVNALLVFGFAGFGITSWQLSRSDPEAVVSVYGDTDRGRLKDLAGRLVSAPGDDGPAVIVAASGGGTRAALYTSHVLQGLHGLGADRDIVLASGVSGGGVALAYFAAHYEALAGPKAVADDWNRFRERVAGNLIGDVLEGASEWRIFGASPLTTLLAESFERRLFRDTRATTMQAGEAPALILNTTIAGHPAEDSQILMRTLDRVPDSNAEACREAERPYNMMNGGRLVFTNLKNTAGFPGEQSAVPDVRLPYWVVNEPRVPIAYAAALNANFPPVFPNARVRIVSRLHGKRCSERSYFVTDGGAEENLGLVSALYAVQGALEELQTRCKSGGCPLRALHFVIAEASATAYDYVEDRGVSAGVGGAKERMTGGLTDILIDQTRRMYAALGGDPEKLRLHYLPLPLTFRARGGFGTHWMQAGSFDLTDPRLRSVSGGREGRRHSALSLATISKEEIDLVWLALHHPRAPYCGNRSYGSIVSDKVRRWICGAPGDPHAPRDLHVDAWQTLVKEIRK